MIVLFFELNRLLFCFHNCFFFIPFFRCFLSVSASCVAQGLSLHQELPANWNWGMLVQWIRHVCTWNVSRGCGRWCWSWEESCWSWAEDHWGFYWRIATYVEKDKPRHGYSMYVLTLHGLRSKLPAPEEAPCLFVSKRSKTCGFCQTCNQRPAIRNTYLRVPLRGLRHEKPPPQPSCQIQLYWQETVKTGSISHD